MNNSSQSNSSTVSFCALWPQGTWHESVDPSKRQALSLVSQIINGVACPFTVVLNALVIVALFRKPSLRSKSNLLLGCMAATDFLTGLVMQPLLVAQEVIRSRGVGLLCAVEDAYYLMARTVVVCSLFHLTFMNLERYIAMKFTLRHMVIVTGQRVAVASISAWMISILLNICVPFCSTDDCRFYPILFYAANITLFLCVLVSTYCCFVVTRTSRRHQRQIAAEYKSTGPLNALEQSNVNFLFLAITVLMFVSFGQVVLLRVLERLSKKNIAVLQPMSETLLGLNSLFNPLLYCARNRAFRQAFREILLLRRIQTGLHR